MESTLQPNELRRRLLHPLLLRHTSHERLRQPPPTIVQLPPPGAILLRPSPFARSRIGCPIAPILNKVGALLHSPIIRNFLGQVRNRVSIPFIMDDSRIFIANLSKGRMGHDKSNLLGSLLITQFQLAAMSRANRPEHERRDFFLHIDEFQNFTTHAFASILAEARKYRLCLTLSLQPRRRAGFTTGARASRKGEIPELASRRGAKAAAWAVMVAGVGIVLMARTIPGAAAPWRALIVVGASALPAMFAGAILATLGTLLFRQRVTSFHFGAEGAAGQASGASAATAAVAEFPRWGRWLARGGIFMGTGAALLAPVFPTPYPPPPPRPAVVEPVMEPVPAPPPKFHYKTPEALKSAPPIAWKVLTRRDLGALGGAARPVLSPDEKWLIWGWRSSGLRLKSRCSLSASRRRRIMLNRELRLRHVDPQGAFGDIHFHATIYGKRLGHRSQPPITLTAPSKMVCWESRFLLPPNYDAGRPCRSGVGVGFGTMSWHNDSITLGFRFVWGGEVPLGILPEDALHHAYVLGQTGSGKTTLLRNLILQHIHRGDGVAVIDPHGDLSEELLHHIPPWRTDHVVYFDPADVEFPIGFNPLADVPPSERPLVASGIVEAFKSIWGDSWGPRMQYILYNSIAALLDCPNTSLLGVNRMLIDPAYRSWVVRQVRDPFIRKFWEQEFASYEPRFVREAIAPIQNKVGALIQSPLIRNILGQVRSRVSIPFVMNDSRIFIANLSKGRMGNEQANLLGSLLVSQFQLAAMARAHLPESARRRFHLFIDEFQNFTTDAFAAILAEARKFRLCLTLSHQYLDQLPLQVRQAVFGNVGSLIAFRVGFADAEILSAEFGHEYAPQAFTNLSKFHALTRLHTNGQPQRPERVRMLGPLEMHCGNKANLLSRSRERFTTPRMIVEERIRRWLEGGRLP